MSNIITVLQTTHLQLLRFMCESFKLSLFLDSDLYAPQSDRCISFQCSSSFRCGKRCDKYISVVNTT